VLAAYVSGHGYGHWTRLGEVLRAIRALDRSLPLTLVGELPEALVRRAVPGHLSFRRLRCDVGLVQRSALEIDEEATAERCREFDATWEERVAAESDFLRRSGARLVLGDIPPLAFAASARAGIPSLALGNFSWDWIYRHLAVRRPSLASAAQRAAWAYSSADLLLELPFSGDLGAFPRRERVGLVARRPKVGRAEARRALGLGSEVTVLVSFGGIGQPDLTPDVLSRDAGLRFLWPADVEPHLDQLGLGYPDVVGAVDVVLTKPGYGIVSDAIAARARVVYTDRGDFPEYPILVREMPRHLACTYVSREDLRTGRLADPIDRVLRLPLPETPDLGGANRAAARVLAALS